MNEPRSAAPVVDATQLPVLSRWKRAFTALAEVLRDPEKTDQVLVFSTYANAGTMPDRIHHFLQHPVGAQLYAEHRTIDGHTIDLVVLGALPEGTLGRAYAEFLSSRGFTPDVFEGTPEELPDPAMAYVVQRLRQTHDLWHVVTGYETDPASEVALQAFTYGQLRAPSSGILALLGTLRGSQLKRDLAVDVVRAYRLGTQAEGLAVFPWEDHWTTPLVEVRAMLKLPIAPTAPGKLADAVRAIVAQLAAEQPSAENRWMTAAATNPPRAAA